MSYSISAAAQWLSKEDRLCFEERLSRLQWLVDKAPKAEYWTFPGGLLAKSLFEEMRYCFVYGQFLASVLLGLAYLERTLAALFYQAGRNDLERASLSDLLREALDHGWIDQSEFGYLEKARQHRNVYAHFRRPGHENSLEYRAIVESEEPYTIIAQDATVVVAAAYRMLARNAV